MTPTATPENLGISPPRRPPRQTDQDFTKGLKWSAITHVVILLVLLIKTVVFPDTPTAYIPSLRVDLVGLPDVLKKDLKMPQNAASEKAIQDAMKKADEKIKAAKPAPKAAPPKEVASPDDMVLKPKKIEKDHKERSKDMKSALARIKALSKISSDEKRLEEAAAAVVKGNKLSKGTSLSGDAKETDQVSYYDHLRERLNENWTLPVWLTRQNLSAQVRIFIDSKGKLRDFRFEKASGNAQFDEAVKRTLQQSQPYPIPPGELAAKLLVNGVPVGFPL